MSLPAAFARTAHRAMLALQSREARMFRDGIPQAARFQEDRLRGYLRAHTRTGLGRAYGFADLRGYSEFVERVPVLDYEAHRPFIERLAAGEAGLLHPGRTLFLEETSGSTGGPKLIPYGKALQGEFQRGLSTWMQALAREHPGAFRGRMYWSLSPALRVPRRSPGGIPIGVEGDSGYFDPLKALLLKAALAVPESLRAQRDADAFYLTTLISLLAAPDLSFISCWSPTFFLQLDRFLIRERDRILAGLRASPRPLNALAFSRLAAILSGPFTWADLWPGLACVSCWTHGPSVLWLPALQERLGSVPLQPKGLLSTECFVSLPFQAGLDPVLAYRSHFFEFREEASRGAIVPMEGLRDGATYEVIVTTGGGLCRYPTGDLVRVTSLASGLPSLRFLGRRSGWTDMAGEKVSEAAALTALEDVRRGWRADAKMASRSSALPEIAGGALVACARIEGGSRYRLLLEWKEWNAEPASSAPVPAQAIASAMEERLSENPYYRQARALGQLEKLEFAILAPGSMERVLAAYQRRRRVGDGTVKLPFLFEAREWDALREDHAVAL